MVLVIAGRFWKCWSRFGQACTHEFQRVSWTSEWVWDGRQNGIDRMVSERVLVWVSDMEGSQDGHQSDPGICLGWNHNMKNPEHHRQMKHLDLWFYWLQDEVNCNNIKSHPLPNKSYASRCPNKAIGICEAEHMLQATWIERIGGRWWWGGSSGGSVGFIWITTSWGPFTIPTDTLLINIRCNLARISLSPT